MRRRLASGKARDRMVEAAPEEVDRADLAEKARAEPLEHPVDLEEDAPEAKGGIRIVGGMHPVLTEWDRVRQLVRAAVDSHADVKLGERRHQRVVEVGNRLRREREAALLAGTGLDQQRMVDEVEIDLERPALVRDR
jgi:hypothetical protein